MFYYVIYDDLSTRKKKLQNIRRDARKSEFFYDIYEKPMAVLLDNNIQNHSEFLNNADKSEFHTNLTKLGVNW